MFPHVLFNASLGENQDSSDKRIDSFCKGYLKGSPDIQILEVTEQYNGLFLELKSPTGMGSLTEAQLEVHQQLKDRGYKVIVSNDYEWILFQLKEYIDKIRFKCQYCWRRNMFYRSKETRFNHYRFFHRI